ncbi:MAG: site-specific integrase [Oscillospiraceae bacterium]|nr:site-specific integrase [Oscillospiraceae bacterium]
MASVGLCRKNKDGSYSFVIRILVGVNADGKKKYAVHTYRGEPTWSKETTRKKALSHASILEDDYKRGFQASSKIRFSEYAAHVIETKEKLNIIKHSTANRYRDSLNKVSGEIGHLKLSALKATHLNSLYIKLQETVGPKTGRPPAPKTILEHHRFISMVLEEAFKEGLVNTNVAKRANPPKLQPHEVNFYDEDVAKRILAAADAESPKWKTLLYVLMFSGVRKGELLGLRWSNVDYLNNTISVKENILYEPDIGVYVDTPKTPKSLRTISLPSSIMGMLKELQQLQETERQRVGAYPDCNGYIFANEDGAPMHPDSIGPFLKRFEMKNGLPKLNAHAFRHTMASMLYMEGLDSVSISARLGHAQVSTTANIYAHALPKRDKDNSDALEKLFLNNKQPDSSD